MASILEEKDAIRELLAAYALDYSVFSGFHVAVREAWMATWGTGVIIASLGGAWRAVFGTPPACLA